MAKQKTLVLFREAQTATAQLSNEQFGELMRALFDHRFCGTDYAGDDSAVAMAYGFIANQVDRVTAISEERSRSGTVGGMLSKPKQSEANESKPKRSEAPVQSSPIISIPNQSSHIQSSPLGGTDRLTPSVSDVISFAGDNNIHDETAQKFWQYNEERNWMTTGGPVKDWKAALLAWAAREREDKQQEGNTGKPWWIGGIKTL